MISTPDFNKLMAEKLFRVISSRSEDEKKKCGDELHKSLVKVLEILKQEEKRLYELDFINWFDILNFIMSAAISVNMTVINNVAEKLDKTQLAVASEIMDMILKRVK